MSAMIVDAENVRRSLWPNLGRDDLVALCGARAAAEGVDVIVVFDGP
ncbi:MAG: NYN domain-containing protein, partial [Actinobacteria bacterium]|nr:NYN domain-containing protein [Actinomycetota bacterium]